MQFQAILFNMDVDGSSSNFINLVGGLAFILTIAVFLSGIEVCRDIKQKLSVENISFFPFLAIFLNCALWILYGIIIRDNFIIGVNSVGAVLSAFYLTFYFQFVTGNQRNWFLLVVGFGLIMLVLKIWFAMFYIVEYNNQKRVASLYCFASTVMMFGAPLVSAFRVVRTKSTEGMSFTLTLTSLGCSLLWTIYGLLLRDTTIEIPNGLGALLSSLQLLVFILYPKKSAPLLPS